MAASSAATGTCRSQRVRRGTAARNSATLEYEIAWRRRRRRAATYIPSTMGTASTRNSAKGQAKLTSHHPPEPQHREQCTHSEEEQSRCGEDGRDLDVLGHHREVKIDRSRYLTH